jgi:WSTF, HB1, Itc1p, MBD9 motif 1
MAGAPPRHGRALACLSGVCLSVWSQRTCPPPPQGEREYASLSAEQRVALATALGDWALETASVRDALNEVEERRRDLRRDIAQLHYKLRKCAVAPPSDPGKCLRKRAFAPPSNRASDLRPSLYFQ